uniref:Uncharacterized protein n=1 Tax=Avena sativa TaxID=4498 RepID=A0ACD5TGS1_AVESA
MHPQNSSSYSGRMLTHKSDSIDLGHAAVHNQLSASNSRIQAATVPPLRASSSDVISFPTRRARMLDETSAFNLGSHALANVPSRGNSTLGHFMHPHSSSSYSSRMLNREPDSNELIQSAASSSRTPAATLFPLEENFDDVHRHAAMHNQLPVSSSSIHTAMLPQLQANTMINFPARRAGMGDETSASNSGTHASAYVPLRDKSMLAQEFAELSLGRPGSEQFTPLQMMLMQNTEVDIKGKRPAPEVDQIKAKILRLNVASVITRVGLKSAAGVLIRDGSTSQFMTASCFRPMMYMDPALLFAAACCEGIKNALFYRPTTIVLESHQVPLLEQLVASRAAEAVQLNQFVGSHPPCYRIWTISEESNGAACQLVRHALQMEESKKVLKDPPDWLVPYLDQRG